MSITYTDRVYVAYGAAKSQGSEASIIIKDSAGKDTTLPLDFQKFIPVEAGTGTYTLTGVIISAPPATGKAAVATTYRPDSTIDIGANAWGILQYLDHRHVGLAITSSTGEEKRVTFFPSTGTTWTTPIQYKVLVRGGSVWNGVTDARLNITYADTSTTTVTTVTTTQAPTSGNAVGPVPITGLISSFNLQKGGDKSSIVYWAPVETVWVKSNMSLVVIGSYVAPSLAVMLEVGGPQFVKLAKITVTTTPATGK